MSRLDERRVFPYWNLLWELTTVQMKLRDQGTIFGFFWTLLHPILMFIVLYVLFIKWVGKFVNQYAAYLLIGLVFWNFFQKATSVALSSLRSFEGLIMNYKFPREIIVLSSVGAVLWSTLLELVILLIALLLMGVPLHWTWLFLTAALALELTFVTGLSMILAVLAVEYQDMQRIWDVISMALFYLTPIFYPMSIIAESRRRLLLLNPITQVLVAARGCVLDGRLPQFWRFSALSALGVVSFLAGVHLLRRCEGRLADKLFNEMSEAQSEVAVRAFGLGKRFFIGTRPERKTLPNTLRWWITGTASERVLWALRDVHFELKRGEILGVIGPNGSGKSTLLLLLAGILTPSEGGVNANGRINPFFRMSARLHPQLTVLENFSLCSALLGIPRQQFRRLFPDMVAWSELGDFLYAKYGDLSTGLAGRLAFAVAIHAELDIILVDESLGIGDIRFQQKCLKVFDDFRTQRKTLVVVSHSMGTIQDMSDRVLYLNQGRAAFLGDPQEAIERFTADATTTVADGSTSR